MLKYFKKENKGTNQIISGKLFYNNGDRYEGDCQQNKANGKGKYKNIKKDKI